MKIKNEFLEVTINELGAEIESIIDLNKNNELMWNANPEWWNRTSPVLFPIVGKLVDGKYRYNQKEYEMAGHGFLRDQMFEVSEVTETSVALSCVANQQTKEMYPFDFKVTIKYSLLVNSLKISWIVENLGQESMYYSIGAHPAFLANKGDVMTFDTVGNETRQYHLEGPLVSSSNIVEVKDLNLNAELFKNDAIIYDNVRKISLMNQETDTKLTVTFDNFDYVGVWAPYKEGQESPFVCIEPWLGIADEANFTGSLENKKGIKELGPNHIDVHDYLISIE